MYGKDINDTSLYKLYLQKAVYDEVSPVLPAGTDKIRCTIIWKLYNFEQAVYI